MSTARRVVRPVAMLILAAGPLAPGAARADVYDYVLVPYAEQGGPTVRLGLGAARPPRGGGASSHGQAFAIGYGVTPRWYTELWTSWQRAGGREYRGNGWYWSSQFALVSGQRSDWSIYASYWKPDFADSGREWTLGPLWQWSGAGYDLNVNVLAHRWQRPARTSRVELDYQLQWKTLWRQAFGANWEYGAQAYGELGPASDLLPWKRQRHLVGPAVFGRVDAWRWDVALLAGLSDASPRFALRGQLAYRF